jgi:hypothetical protein
MELFNLSLLMMMAEGGDTKDKSKNRIHSFSFLDLARRSRRCNRVHILWMTMMASACTPDEAFLDGSG